MFCFSVCMSVGVCCCYIRVNKFSFEVSSHCFYQTVNILVECLNSDYIYECHYCLYDQFIYLQITRNDITMSIKCKGDDSSERLSNGVCMRRERERERGGALLFFGVWPVYCLPLFVCAFLWCFR